MCYRQDGLTRETVPRRPYCVAHGVRVVSESDRDDVEPLTQVQLAEPLGTAGMHATRIVAKRQAQHPVSSGALCLAAVDGALTQAGEAIVDEERQLTRKVISA